MGTGMKTINTYINEKLRLTTKYTCQPKDKNELRDIIIDRIKNEDKKCDMNDIDVSKIKDMSYLFDARHYKIFKHFNGDISMWNVSNVVDMQSMFIGCAKFNCDISKWNVSNVKYMNAMFDWCEKFNCNLSAWNVSKVENMTCMFYSCEQFNQDLNSWDVSNVENMLCAFKDCPTKPTWYDIKQWE